MPNYKRTKYACYYSYLSMSSVFSLPPMLFITFHEMYGLSFTILGSLLLINFCTQLAIDLVFSFFPKYFNIQKTVRIMPFITSAGLFIYALVPHFFPEQALAGLIVGTVIFSVSSGLAEVLLSPVVAAIPSETPEKDMSLLHSLYGWGVVSVVLISSAFFKLFGTANWVALTCFWAILPLGASLLFFLSPMPAMDIGSVSGGGKQTNKSKTFLLCIVCIFLGACAENTMTGWISSYMEKALLVPKAAGDVLGMAVFALLLAGTRTVYAKYGKNIGKTLFFGMCGAAVCYILAGGVNNVIVGFIACICTGICTSMLWPGTLILLEERVPNPGVAAYALMAAGGDLGAAFAPQLLGILVDKFSASGLAASLCEKYAFTPDQAGLKFGMLCAAVFPILGAIWLLTKGKVFKKEK